MALEPKDRDRLEKLLNMLGSPNEGEIGNAGRMIQKMAERYNVTPATLCLGNPQPPQSEQPKQDYTRDRYGNFHANGFTGRSWNASGGGPWGGRSWADEEMERQQQEMRREKERRDAKFHEDREAELRAAAAKRAREQANKEARKRRHFGSYFGLLARLKAVYDEQFEGLENWQLDFIEIVLTECKADRMMTTRQRDMAKALLKQNEQAEPLV